MIGGLTTSSTYFVAVQNSTTVKLHDTESDVAGINTVSLTSFGIGNHRLVSTNLKKKISSIDVVESGSGYKNRKISIPTSGINTYSTVTAKNQIFFWRDCSIYN